MLTSQSLTLPQENSCLFGKRPHHVSNCTTSPILCAVTLTIAAASGEMGADRRVVNQALEVVNTRLRLVLSWGLLSWQSPLLTPLHKLLHKGGRPYLLIAEN